MKEVTKQLVVLVGLPGSGKSTIRHKLYPNPYYYHISQDEQGKEQHKHNFAAAIEDGLNIVIDRCNFNVEQRQRYIKPAREAGYEITIVWLQVPAEECIARINERRDHPNLAKGNEKIAEVVRMFDGMFKAPEDWEADRIIKL